MMKNPGAQSPAARPRAGGGTPAPMVRAAPAAPARLVLPPVWLQGELVQFKAFQTALKAYVDGVGKDRTSGGAEQGLKKDLLARIKTVPAPICEFLVHLDGIVEICGDSFNKDLELLVEPITSVMQPVLVSALALGAPKAKDKQEFARIVLRYCSREVIEEGLVQMMITEWRHPENFLRTTSTFCAVLQRSHLTATGLETEAGKVASGDGDNKAPCTLAEARKLNATWGGYQVPKVLREYVRRQARRLRNSVQAGEACAQRFISDQVFLKHLCPMLAIKGQMRASNFLIRVVNGVQKSAKTGDMANDVWGELGDLVRSVSIQVTPPPGR